MMASDAEWEIASQEFTQRTVTKSEQKQVAYVGISVRFNLAA